MAFKTQQNAPLTESQLELTAKVGSMKSLLSLPFNKNKFIPKDQQMSTFDYLLKVLRALGFPPEPLFRLFIEKIFSSTETFLEEKVLDAIGASLDSRGITISSSKSNGDALRDAIPATFLQTVKLKMAKELTIMVFGPKVSQDPNESAEDATRRAEIVGQALCGSNMFKLSNDAAIRNEDIEFNRIKLRQELEKGEITFEISCQDVKIKLPEDPGIFFGEGGVNTQTSRPVTPAQSINLVVNHVSSETGKINNQNNADSAGKSFFEILIEKLIGYITTLVIPYVGPVFAMIQDSLNQPNVTVENTMISNCSMESNSSNENIAFSKSLMNSLYKELLKIILLFAIRAFKKLVAGYFARSARERMRRKSDKIKMKFNLLGGLADGAKKAAKYAAALKSLSSLLG